MITILKKSAVVVLLTFWFFIAVYTFWMSIIFSLTGMILEEPGLMAGYIGLAIVSGGGWILFFVRRYRRTGQLV